MGDMMQRPSFDPRTFPSKSNALPLGTEYYTGRSFGRMRPRMIWRGWTIQQTRSTVDPDRPSNQPVHMAPTILVQFSASKPPGGGRGRLRREDKADLELSEP